MLQFIHNRNIGSSCQLPSLFSSYSLRELDRSNYLKNGGVLLGFNNVGDLLIGYSCSTIPNTTNSIQISYCFIYLYAQITTFDSQVNAVDNILTIDLSKHYKTIKATGFVLNSNPITKIRHIKASPQHIILPFTCDKISYQTINIDGNTFYRKKQYYTTTKTDNLQEEHFENIVSAKNYCKTFLLNHYSSEKLTHPFRYTSLLSNSTTFSGKTVPALTHPSGIYLTF
ncbi:Uncharacterized protein QTN25_007675 [Entamoeba marina]